MTDRGSVGKTATVGAQDRESNQVRVKVVESTDADTLIDFVEENAATGAEIYTDDAQAYHSLPDLFKHESVKPHAVDKTRHHAVLESKI